MIINHVWKLGAFIIVGLASCKSSNIQKTANSTNTPVSLDEVTSDNVGIGDYYKDDFLIGAAISLDHINEKYPVADNLISKEFNTITSENIMKWMFIHPEQDSFFFNDTDTYIALGHKQNKKVVGHTLVWHSQLAPWVSEINDSTALSLTLSKHIESIVSRYAGQIDFWDVVNEALNEDGSYRESLFQNIIGEQYLVQAFKEAARWDTDVPLIYNDYNLWKPLKRAGVVRLMKLLKENNAPIHGIGMQGHWGLAEPSLEDIENSILAYANEGMKVSITELDITVLPNPWDLEGAEISQNFEEDPSMNPYQESLPDSITNLLADRYEAIFQLFLKHKDIIERVTFWGVNDGHTWLNNWPIKNRTNYPLLFDRQYNPKEAYLRLTNLKKNN